MESVTDPSNSMPIALSKSQLASVAIDNALFQRVTVTIQPDLRAMRGCEAVVGLDLLNEYLVTLDLPQSRLSLEKGRNLQGEAGVLAYIPDHGIPTINIAIGTRGFRANIDTMAPGFSVPSSEMKRLEVQYPPVLIGKGRSVNGDFDIFGAVLKDDIHVGEYTFRQSFIEFNPRFPIATMGLSALRHFAIRIDPSHHLIQFLSDRAILQIPSPSMNFSTIPHGP